MSREMCWLRKKCYVLLLVPVAMMSWCCAVENCTGVSSISSDNSCFWYQTVPGDNSRCSLQEDVSLQCDVYMPRDENNDPIGTVTWVKFSRNTFLLLEPTTMFLGMSPSQGTSSFPSGLYSDQYPLKLQNVGPEDDGLYWCQIEVNGLCTLRSDFIHIDATSVTNCSTTNFNIEHGSSPILANRTVGCDRSTTTTSEVPTTNLPETTEMLTLFTTLGEPRSTGDTTPMSPMTSVPMTCGSDSATVLCLAVILPTVIFTLILVIMGLGCAGFCLYQNRRKQRIAISGVERDKPTVIPLDENSTAVLVQTHPYEDVEAIFDSATGQSVEPQYHEIESSLPNTRSVELKESHTYETVVTAQSRENAKNKLFSEPESKNIPAESIEPEYNQLFDENTNKTAVQEQSVHTYAPVVKNKGSSQTKEANISMNFNESLEQQEEYSALDHSVASNTTQKATILTALEESLASNERYYSTPQVHQQLLREQDKTNVSQDHEYGKLENNQENANSKGASHDYHELEVSPAPYQTPVPSKDTDTSSSQIFDDSQYSRLTTDHVKGPTTQKQISANHGQATENDYSVLRDVPKATGTPSVPPPRILQKAEPTYNKLDFSHESAKYDSVEIVSAGVKVQQNETESTGNSGVTQIKEESLFDDMKDVQEVWI